MLHTQYAYTDIPWEYIYSNVFCSQLKWTIFLALFTVDRIVKIHRKDDGGFGMEISNWPQLRFESGSQGCLWTNMLWTLERILWKLFYVWENNKQVCVRVKKRFVEVPFILYTVVTKYVKHTSFIYIRIYAIMLCLQMRSVWLLSLYQSNSDIQ